MDYATHDRKKDGYTWPKYGTPSPSGPVAEKDTLRWIDIDEHSSQARRQVAGATWVFLFVQKLRLHQKVVLSGTSCAKPPAGLILKDMLNEEVELDRVFQALADPSRRAMVERLSRGPASVTELARPLAMSLAAVVQHLKVLEVSGLVRSQKVGRVRTCRMEPSAMDPAQQWITERRTGWERCLDRLGDFLTEQSAQSEAFEHSDEGTPS